MPKIVDAVFDQYINSGDFNGLSVRLCDASNADVITLIKKRKLDLVRGDGHPNPHIKAFPADAVEAQVEKIKSHGLEGCLYPTPELLKERDAGKGEMGPFTKELKEGVPQLDFRTFDLRALEWYRLDPRFQYDVDDIHGSIHQKEGTEIAGRGVAQDRLEFLEFGFAYNKSLQRAVAVFLRYLHDLPSEQQLDISRYLLGGELRPPPRFLPDTDSWRLPRKGIDL